METSCQITFDFVDQEQFEVSSKCCRAQVFSECSLSAPRVVAWNSMNAAESLEQDGMIM